jgi:hypothetical protein
VSDGHNEVLCQRERFHWYRRPYVENRTDRVSVYGSIDLTRDKHGLDQAQALRALMDLVIAVLEADKELPAHVAPPEKPDKVKNPFA